MDGICLDVYTLFYADFFWGVVALDDDVAHSRPPCSGDTGTISHKDRMIQPSGYDGIVLSGGSTAPGLTDGKEYPLLARLATNENDALAPIIAKYGWMKIAILNDDTIWGTGSYDYFSRLFKETSGKDAEILNEDSNTHLRVVDMAAFDADPDGHAVTLLASLKAVDARVIVLIVQQRVQRAIYAAIARTNPFDGKRIALLTTWISVSSMINDDKTPNADAMIGSEGLIGISPGSFLPPPSNSEQARYLERWDADSSSEGCITDRYSGSAAKESTRQLPERDWMHHSQTFAGKRARLLGYCDADGLPPLPDFSANIADAVIVLARALDNVLKRTDANAARTSPAEVFAEIQNLKIFQGITGGVKLKSGSEDLAGKLTVVNRRLCTNAQCVAVAGADSSRRKRQRRSVITQRGVDVPVAEYDSAANELLTLYAPNRSSKVFSTFNCRKAAAGDVCLVEFPGGGTEPPLDSEPQTHSSVGLVVTLTTLLVLVVFASIGRLWHVENVKRRPHDFAEDVHEILMAEGRQDSFARSQVPREIKRKCVELIDKVGEGQFGDVYKAVVDESNEQFGVPGYTVAIKTVSEKSNTEGSRELLHEGK